jgi:nucleosome assembly protein 1-like 1
MKVEAKDVGYLANVEGVPDFWLVALKNHKTIGPNIEACDEPVLRHVTNIEFKMIPNGRDFSLKF